MESKELFAIADQLDLLIDSLENKAKTFEQKCELSDLKAYRAHVQEGIEASIASLENQTGE